MYEGMYVSMNICICEGVYVCKYEDTCMYVCSYGDMYI